MTKPNKDWFSNILRDLRKIDSTKDMPNIICAMKANEKIVGTVTGEYTKKLMILACNTQNEIDEMIRSIEPTNAYSMITEANKKINTANILIDMFWTSIYSQLGDAVSMRNIALRENWTIVTYEYSDDTDECLGEVFGPPILIGFSCGPTNENNH